MRDIIGAAMLDYINNNYTEDIVTSSSISEEDCIPVPYLFRSFEEMPLIEQHKKIMKLLEGKFESGELHALSLETKII